MEHLSDDELVLLDQIINREIMFYQIDNPSEALCCEILKKVDSSYIRYIDNPSTELKKLALEIEPRNIRHLTDNSDIVEYLATLGHANERFVLSYLNMNECDTVVKINPDMFWHVPYQSDESIRIAIHARPKNTKFIRRPVSEDLMAEIILLGAPKKHVDNLSLMPDNVDYMQYYRNEEKINDGRYRVPF